MLWADRSYLIISFNSVSPSHVHPQLDRRMPSMDHFLNNAFIKSDDTQLFCNPKLGVESPASDVHKRAWYLKSF